MSSSSSPSVESAHDLWTERSELAGTFLGGVAQGVHACVFFTTVYFMTRKLPQGKRLPWFYLCFVSALFALGTVTVAGTALISQRTWIDDRNETGGPAAWNNLHYSSYAVTLGNAAYIFANFLADGLVLYRLWVIWNSYLILVVPVLAYMASTALSILTLFQAAQPGASLYSHTAIVFAVPYWSLSISLNIVVTILIACRLLALRNRVRHFLGPEHAEMYTSIMAIIVESTALYSSFGLLFIITFARNSNIQNLVLPVLGEVMCIAPELIVLRVALGRAWTRETTTRAITGESWGKPVFRSRSQVSLDGLGASRHAPSSTVTVLENLSSQKRSSISETDLGLVPDLEKAQSTSTL